MANRPISIMGTDERFIHHMVALYKSRLGHRQVIDKVTAFIDTDSKELPNEDLAMTVMFNYVSFEYKYNKSTINTESTSSEYYSIVKIKIHWFPTAENTESIPPIMYESLWPGALKREYGEFIKEFLTTVDEQQVTYKFEKQMAIYKFKIEATIDSTCFESKKKD
jgi:hypothetical protein